MINEIIKIDTREDGTQILSARELYKLLEVKTDFTDWCKRMFEYGFSEYTDFILLKNEERAQQGIRQPKPKNDYALTLDCAKEIAMLQRTEKGKQIRTYFIEYEKKHRLAKPITTAEQLLVSAQIMVDYERKSNQMAGEIKEVREEVKRIAANQTRVEYYTAVGYAALKGVKNFTIKTAANVGRKASKICADLGYTIDKMPDPRFGMVNLYPKDVLDIVFTELAQES